MSGRLYWCCILLFCGTAWAQVPAVPPLPGALGEAAAAPLRSRIDEFSQQRRGFIEAGARHNERCRSVTQGSPEHAACTDSRQSVLRQLSALRESAARLETDIAAAVASERRRLEQAVRELDSRIARDLTAIRNLGFDRRAEDFERWALMSREARAAREKEWRDQLTDVIASEVQDHMLDAFRNMDRVRIDALIRKLESNPDVPMYSVVGVLREALDDGTRARTVDQAKALVKGIERGLQGTRAGNREDWLRFATELLCDFAEALPGLRKCTVFKAIGFSSLASVENFGAQQIANARINELSTRTEKDLSSLKRLDDLMVRHVGERKAARDRLAELGLLAR